jgi:hypothetical protein
MWLDGNLQMVFLSIQSTYPGIIRTSDVYSKIDQCLILSIHVTMLIMRPNMIGNMPDAFLVNMGGGVLVNIDGTFASGS